MQNFQGAGLAISKCPARSPKYCINIIRGSHIGSIQHLRTSKRNEQKLIRNASKVHGALPNPSGTLQGQRKEQTCGERTLQDM